MARPATDRTPRRVGAIALLLVISCAPAACAPDDGVPADPPADSPADPRADGTPASGPADEARAGFLARYAGYCGASYQGRSVMVDLGDDHPLDDARLRMTLADCAADEVRIPFQVNDDRSRTWILTRANGDLHLAHDHRYEDGTEHDANLYGGYADDRGSDTKQFFPADDRTIADRPAREINTWSKEFDLENQRYYYRLYLRGELRYEAEFDLGRPIPLNGPE